MADFQKYKLKYTGVYPVRVMCPGFHGDVSLGDVIDVARQAVDELRGHNDWELVTEKKQKQEVE